MTIVMDSDVLNYFRVSDHHIVIALFDHPSSVDKLQSADILAVLNITLSRMSVP